MAAWFDATNIDPSQGSANFPVGRHLVVIKSSSIVPVKDKPNAGMLVFKCEVIDGPSKGLIGDYRLNLWNDNAQAAEIAGRQLSAICHVVNTYQLNAKPEGVELFNKPFQIIVEPQADPKYTQITGVLDLSGNQPQKGQQAVSPQQAQAAQPVQQPQQPQQPAQSAPAWAQQPQQGYPAQQAAPAAGSTPPWGAR